MYYNDVIYEIYPLTFNYAPGSASDPYQGAYGNLKGITAMASYVASLNVDAIWIAPFFKWNRNGFGYDITDYYEIDPMFGTLDDLEELCHVYHKYGIRVIIDQVYNHCSEKNPWFQQSIKKIMPYQDYFIWCDAKGFDERGNPIVPNNWPSVWDFSGTSAWTWNKERQQFYMHSFDSTMPNLNISNPVVRQELLKVAKHWFDVGVDGFRLDATTHYACDEQFRDNPLDDEGNQRRIYDINTKTGALFIDELKALANTYQTPKILLAEYNFDKGKDGNEKGVQTVRTSCCDSFYIASLRGRTLKSFVEGVKRALEVSPYGEKINWAFSNHDMERATTRFFGDKFNSRKSTMLMQMLLTLPGSVCIYQGDELGMPSPVNLENCKNLLRDKRHVWSIAHKVIDGARAGFCVTMSSHSNMAFHPDDRQKLYCVENQSRVETSTLNEVRKAIEYRKLSGFEDKGNVIFLETNNPDAVAYIRTDVEGTERVLCIFNFSTESVIIDVDNAQYIVRPDSYEFKKLA